MMRVALFITCMLPYVYTTHELLLYTQFQCHSATQYTAKIRFTIVVKAKITTCDYSKYVKYGYDLPFYYYRCILPENWVLVSSLGYQEDTNREQPNCDINDRDDFHFKKLVKEFVIENFPTASTSLQSPISFNGNGVKLIETGVVDNSFPLRWLLTSSGNEYEDDSQNLYRDFFFTVDRCTCKDVPSGYEVLYWNANPGQWGRTQVKKICEPGTKSVQTENSPICQQCEIGYFQPFSGMTYCYNCDVRSDDVYYPPDATVKIAQNKLGACTKYTGRTSPQDCNFCERGYYCAEIDSVTKRCKFLETTSDGITALQHQCEECASNWSTPDIGVYDISKCEGTCAEGEIKTANTCNRCNVGQCADTSSNECLMCFPGTKAEKAITCKRNVISEMQCDDCEFGKYQFMNEQQECSDCSAGKYSNKTTCWDDIDNIGSEEYKKWNCDENLRECDSYKCKESSMNCKKCAIGSFSESGSTSCTSCEPGETSNDNDKIWNNGELERLTQALLPTTCVPCPRGTKSSEGDCIKCEDHHISDGGVESCTACPAGKTHNTDHSACVDCPQYYLRYTELSKFEHFFSDGEGCKGCYDVKGGNYVIDISPRLVADNATCKRCEFGSYCCFRMPSILKISLPCLSDTYLKKSRQINSKINQ